MKARGQNYNKHILWEVAQGVLIEDSKGRIAHLEHRTEGDKAMILPTLGDAKGFVDGTLDSAGAVVTWKAIGGTDGV
jgi:hypothetical protein